jgi:DNA-binding NarL/FixJ family response regulator
MRTVLLADDHNLVRRGLAALLNTSARYRVVGEASNGEDALALAREIAPDVLILDLSMPRLSGLETIKRIKKNAPGTRVLVLSMYGDEQFVAQALRGGARGYLLKHAMDEELFNALDAVVAGERYLSKQIDSDRVGDDCACDTELTAREREVLQLIVDGKTTPQIAEVLSISPHTAIRHRANLMQKLGAHNQAELMRCAARLGVVILSA